MVRRVCERIDWDAQEEPRGGIYNVEQTEHLPKASISKIANSPTSSNNADVFKAHAGGL